MYYYKLSVVFIFMLEHFILFLLILIKCCDLNLELLLALILTSDSTF